MKNYESKLKGKTFVVTTTDGEKFTATITGVNCWSETPRTMFAIHCDETCFIMEERHVKTLLNEGRVMYKGREVFRVE